MCRVLIVPCDTCEGEGKIAVPAGNDGTHEFVAKCGTCNGEGWVLDGVMECDGTQLERLISTEEWWGIFTEDRPWPTS